MEPIVSVPKETETVLFRPSKKRKIYRRRTQDDDANPSVPLELAETAITSPTLAAKDNVSDREEGLEGTKVSMSEILRLRKLRKHRAGGVEFRATTTSVRADDAQDGAVILHDGQPEDANGPLLPTAGGVRRFAKQTGMVGDVDKHMMAYIDIELAKRRLNAISPHPASKESLQTDSAASNNPSEATLSSKPLERQPATLGKLLEIDLGNEARDRNVVRTEQARRRLDGEEVEDDALRGGKPKKVRLGRDGKPWRERKRRTSDDIKRDKLVEEVLRENRLELYEEPTAPTLVNRDPDDDGEADDRIAEAFRREFMDAVSQRQRKKPLPAPPARGVGGKKEEEVLKGPKLGGSRSARAAMREAQLRELRGKK